MLLLAGVYLQGSSLLMVWKCLRKAHNANSRINNLQQQYDTEG